MDELMKTLEGGSKDEDKETITPREVHGVLALHLKTIKLLYSDTFDLHSSMLGLLRVRASVCGYAKLFSLHPSENHDTVLCNQLNHFPIELHEKASHSSNQLTLELVISSPLLPGAVSAVGMATLHVPHLIHQSPLSGSCELKHVESFSTVGLISADWAFCYGSYGYGESYQLYHSARRSSDYLNFSLLPRIAITHTEGLVLTSKHPSFIPFTERAQLCVHDSASPGEQAYTSPRPLLGEMKRLHSLHKQFKSKSDRKERLKFLEGLILSNSGSQGEGLGAGVTARKDIM